jgi:hypothetical protein
MNKNMKKVSCRRALFIFLSVLVMGIILSNVTVSIRVGEDGRYTIIKMPLYVKWTQFLARHYEYARIAKEATAGCKTDEEKALALLAWTRHNLKDTPAGMPIRDDHILNIIIRGCGVPEQFQDVFTTLSSYSGMPAYWAKPYDLEHKTRYAVSFVKIGGKWRIFDAYRGAYFKNDKGVMASVEDQMKEPVPLPGADAHGASEVHYNDYFGDLGRMTRPWTTRPQRQMPLPRIVYEIRKAVGLEKDGE